MLRPRPDSGGLCVGPHTAPACVRGPRGGTVKGVVQGWYQGGVFGLRLDPTRRTPWRSPSSTRGPLVGTPSGAPAPRSHLSGTTGSSTPPEIARGLDVMELYPSGTWSPNEIAAAKTVGSWSTSNAQEQSALRVPATLRAGPCLPGAAPSGEMDWPAPVWRPSGRARRIQALSGAGQPDGAAPCWRDRWGPTGRGPPEWRPGGECSPRPSRELAGGPGVAMERSRGAVIRGWLQVCVEGSRPTPDPSSCLGLPDHPEPYAPTCVESDKGPVGRGGSSGNRR